MWKQIIVNFVIGSSLSLDDGGWVDVDGGGGWGVVGGGGVVGDRGWGIGDGGWGVVGGWGVGCINIATMCVVICCQQSDCVEASYRQFGIRYFMH